MKVTICIGSSCHLKGSREIIEKLQSLLSENDISHEVELCGAFCMRNCVNGVSVTIGEKTYSVKPENVNEFFEDEILPHLNKC